MNVLLLIPGPCLGVAYHPEARTESIPTNLDTKHPYRVCGWIDLRNGAYGYSEQAPKHDGDRHTSKDDDVDGLNHQGYPVSI